MLDHVQAPFISILLVAGLVATKFQVKDMQPIFEFPLSQRSIDELLCCGGWQCPRR